MRRSAPARSSGAGARASAPSSSTATPPRLTTIIGPKTGSVTAPTITSGPEISRSTSAPRI